MPLLLLVTQMVETAVSVLLKRSAQKNSKQLLSSPMFLPHRDITHISTLKLEEVRLPNSGFETIQVACECCDVPRLPRPLTCSNLANSTHSHTCLHSLSLAMQVLSQPIPTHTLPVHPSSHVGLLFLFVFEFCYLDMFLVILPVCLLTCVPACCSACKL